MSAEGEGLRERLEMSGDLSGVKGDTLSAALRRFQHRRHINPSGSLDGVTLAAINQPVEEQIAQIELNMERWRWLPHDPEARYMLVRLDDYELDFYKPRQARVYGSHDCWKGILAHAYIQRYDDASRAQSVLVRAA